MTTPPAAISNVLQMMTGKTVTLGWDVVVGYDASSVNDLFAQQFVGNVGTNQCFAPITVMVPISSVQVQLVNVVLGPPLISFNPQLTDQQATVDLNFVAGDVLVLDQSGPVQYVNGYQSIVPGDQYTLQMIVELEQVEGKVTKNRAVVVNLQNASTYSANLLAGSAAASYLGQYFQALFEDEAQGTLTYELGSLTFGTSENLVPAWFDIRTQAHPNSSTGDGAVLLFVATNYNKQGGDLPGTSFPYLIPQSYGCYVVVASKTLFGNIMSSYYQKHLAGSPALDVMTGSGSNPSSYLAFTGGGIDCGTITASWGGTISYKVWSGSKGSWPSGSPEYKHVTVPFNGLTIEPSNNLLTVSWSNNWNEQWTGTTTFGRRAKASSSNIMLSISGSFTATPKCGSTDVVSFSGSGSPAITFQSSSWLSTWFGDGDSRKQAGATMVGKAAPIAKQVLNFQIPQVDTFAVDHLLFPAENVMQLSDIYVPGDLVLFGSITPTATAFMVTPLQSVIAAGETLQLAVTNGVTVSSWAIHPLVGSISQSGVYTAPSSVPKAVPIVVTATAPSSSSTSDEATAILTVVPSPISVSPAFTMVFPSGEPVQFNAAVLGNLGAPAWSLSPSVASVGSIDATGLYTPPSPLPSGVVTSVTITATVGGQSASALVALVDTVMAFNLSPMYATLTASETQQFTATDGTDTGTGDTTFNWSVLPSASGAGRIDKTTGLYTAPGLVPQNTTALVLATDTSDTNLVAIGLVILTAS